MVSFLRTDTFIPISIGLIQVFFFNKLADNIFDINKYKDTYNYEVIHLNFNEKKENTENKENKEKEFKKTKDELYRNETKKFIFMIIVATIIFLIITQIEETISVKFGLGLGSLFMIVYALYMNWYNMNEIMKLTVLGIALLALIFSVSKFNNFYEYIYPIANTTKN